MRDQLYSAPGEVLVKWNLPGRADRTGQDRTRIPITVRSEARGAILPRAHTRPSSRLGGDATLGAVKGREQTQVI